jgi:hypothetical protein
MWALSSELGALAFGAMLAKHKRATELSNSLWAIKEVFLVGFFLQIGIGGLPDMNAMLFAGALSTGGATAAQGRAVLLPVPAVPPARAQCLSQRSSLTNYSEFGLIVASVVLPQWLTPLAITVALSFVISAQLNRISHPLYDRFARRLIPLERNTRHPDEQPVSLGDAQILIMGMGRTGRAAYDHLQNQGWRLISLDSDPVTVEKSSEKGRHVLFADAEDQMFWESLEMNKVEAVILAMNDAEAKIISTRKLRGKGFEGLIVSHAMYEDIAQQIEEAGADRTYLTMSEAGAGLAENVSRELQANR